MPFHPQPKPRAPKLLKADRKSAREAIDKAESDKVRERSGGQCEVYEVYVNSRCPWLAAHIHHMIGGIGKRGIGISALAAHKQHVCTLCHADIGGAVGGIRLRRCGDTVPHWTDFYERVRR